MMITLLGRRRLLAGALGAYYSYFTVTTTAHHYIYVPIPGFMPDVMGICGDDGKKEER